MLKNDYGVHKNIKNLNIIIILISGNLNIKSAY